MIQRPSSNEYAESYADYVSRVPDGNICDFLESQLTDMKQVFSGFSEQQASTPRKENEWTLKQVLGHLCDGERVFGYRALRFARGDETPLPGFEQDLFVAGGAFNERTLPDLLDEFEHLRRANLSLFRTISEETSRKIGTASDNPVSVRALMYIIGGHTRRHLQLINERFSSSAAV